MELSLSREANSSSAKQEIWWILWTWGFIALFKQLTIYICSEPDKSPHTLPSCFFKIHLINILSLLVQMVSFL